MIMVMVQDSLQYHSMVACLVSTINLNQVMSDPSRTWRQISFYGMVLCALDCLLCISCTSIDFMQVLLSLAVKCSINPIGRSQQLSTTM